VLCAPGVCLCLSLCVCPHVLWGCCSVYITGAQGSDPYRARLAELGSGTMLQVSHRSETHMSVTQEHRRQGLSTPACSANMLASFGNPYSTAAVKL